MLCNAAMPRFSLRWCDVSWHCVLNTPTVDSPFMHSRIPMLCRYEVGDVLGSRLTAFVKPPNDSERALSPLHSFSSAGGALGGLSRSVTRNMSVKPSNPPEEFISRCGLVMRHAYVPAMTRLITVDLPKLPPCPPPAPPCCPC